MVARLKLVLARIADGTLLPAAYYSELDCDASLDVRDGDTEFEAEWLRQYEVVERLWVTVAVTDETRGLVEVILRESFLAVSRATQQHEIASYVSDDFDLIVRGQLVGTQSEFLGHLWGVYERGEFPQPPLARG